MGGGNNFSEIGPSACCILQLCGGTSRDLPSVGVVVAFLADGLSAKVDDGSDAAQMVPYKGKHFQGISNTCDKTPGLQDDTSSKIGIGCDILKKLIH